MVGVTVIGISTYYAHLPSLPVEFRHGLEGRSDYRGIRVGKRPGNHGQNLEEGRMASLRGEASNDLRLRGSDGLALREDQHLVRVGCELAPAYHPVGDVLELQSGRADRAVPGQVVLSLEGRITVE